MPRPIVAMLFQGKIQAMPSTPPKNPTRANFVICCNYGDWSGFRTLADCQKQYPELEASAATNKRPDGFFWIEERS